MSATKFLCVKTFAVNSVYKLQFFTFIVVTLDVNQSRDNRINAVSKSIHIHMHLSRHIRSSVSEDMAKIVACALVGSLCFI